MLRFSLSLSLSLSLSPAPCLEGDLEAAIEYVMRIWEEDTVCHAVPLQRFANLEKFSENKSRNAHWFMHCLKHGRQNADRKQTHIHHEKRRLSNRDRPGN